jgi:replication-associated recombination protein RarA
MVGQKHNLEIIENMKNSFPSFLVIVGERGSGKTLLTKIIASTLGAIYTTSGIKVDDIREVISTAYAVREKTVYHIKDADNMRPEAKNAMLKITEEPPENAYFVMTVQNDSSLLDTIKSRAYVLNIEPYSSQDLIDYMTQNYGADTHNYEQIATTPYEVDMLMKYGNDFIDYVNLVVDNIGVVQSANAFKSGSRLGFKSEEDDKYDLKLFWLAFMQTCTHRITNCGNIKLLVNYILITDKYIGKLNSLSVNKAQTYDMWVFEIRTV